MLGARPYETAAGAPTRKQSWSVSGGVFEGYGSGNADIEKLANNHATYRDPYGSIVPVYVTSVNAKRRGIATSASVSMVRESE